MYKVTKHLEVAGSHQLDLPYRSKCTNIHGHNWHIWITISSECLNSEGMVMDFTLIKKEIHDWLDHKHINNLIECNPTAENMAALIAERLNNLLTPMWDGDYEPEVISVKVQESDGNIAEWSI